MDPKVQPQGGSSLEGLPKISSLWLHCSALLGWQYVTPRIVTDIYHLAVLHSSDSTAAGVLCMTRREFSAPKLWHFFFPPVFVGLLTLLTFPSQQAKKTVLITGANKGIGKEVARQLAVRGGYEIYLGARDAARGQATVDELVAAGHKDIHLLVIDVTSDESVKKAFETLSSKVSALDVLVNNAGITAAGFKPALQESLAEFIATYEVNVFGVVRTTNAFIPLLKKSKAGRIVNVSSGLGSIAFASDKNHPYYAYNSLGYNTSKSAVNHVTVSFSKALAEFGIKVNASDPGYTATDLNHNSGPQTVDVGAQSTVFLATLPDDGPTGSYQDKDGVLPW